MASAESVKTKILSLIAQANATTGKNDTDLTNAVKKLIAGYGAGGGACGNSHVIELAELPPIEMRDENAIYCIATENCIDIAIYSEEGEYVMNLLFLLSALLETQISIINVDTLEEVTTPVIAPAALYYCRADKKLYWYTQNEETGEYGWGEGWQPGGESSDLGDGQFVFEKSYTYYRPTEAGFYDIVLVESIVKQSLSEVIPNSSCHTIPTKTTENVLVSNLSDSLLETEFHAYYIEDENDIFIYALNPEKGINEWVLLIDAIEGDGEAFQFKGFVSDINEATANGYYGLYGTGWEKYIMPKGNLTINELGKTFDVREAASVTAVLPEYTGRVVYT